MAINWISSRAWSALPLIAIALALANWNARPDEAWAWAAVIVISLVMVAVRWRTQLAFRQASADAVSIRSLASVTGGVVFGSLMMIIPLALTLAHAYGVVEDPDSGRRTTMIILGAYLAVIGNGIPRMLPPVSSTAVRRRESAGVSAACWLDMGALRPWIRDGLAGAARRRGAACVDGAGCCGHDRDHRATPAPSQAAAARSGGELTAPPLRPNGRGESVSPAGDLSLRAHFRHLSRKKTRRLSGNEAEPDQRERTGVDDLLPAVPDGRRLHDSGLVCRSTGERFGARGTATAAGRRGRSGCDGIRWSVGGDQGG